MMDFSYILSTRIYIYLIFVFSYNSIDLALTEFNYTWLETIEENQETIEEYQDRNLTSPGYPANYPNNANYTWIIETRYLAYVYFDIVFMDIKSSQTTQCNDFLEITEIDPCCHTPLNRCGQFNNTPILTRGNKIKVSFVSDRSETGKGFFLFWNVSFITSPSSPVTATSKKQMIAETFQQSTTIDVETSMSTTETTTWTLSTTILPPPPITTILPPPTTKTTIQTDERNFQVYIFVVNGVIMAGLLFVLGCLKKHRCSLRGRREAIIFNENRMSSNENDLNAVCIYSSVQEAETALNEDSQEGIYMEYPEDVYDTTFVKRPHAKQSIQNIYGICEEEIKSKSEETSQE